MERALKLDENGTVIDHRPVPHKDIDKSWRIVEWTKEELGKQSFNELIAKKALTVDGNKMKISAELKMVKLELPQEVDRVKSLEDRISALEKALSSRE